MGLLYASEDMKNKENVVLAAVQQNGQALWRASKDMKNNENVVLAAVQQNGWALQYASKDMKNKIERAASKFGIGTMEYAGAMRHQYIVQLQVSAVSATQDPIATCLDMAGR